MCGRQAGIIADRGQGCDGLWPHLAVSITHCECLVDRSNVVHCDLRVARLWTLVVTNIPKSDPIELLAIACARDGKQCLKLVQARNPRAHKVNVGGHLCAQRVDPGHLDSPDGINLVGVACDRLGSFPQSVGHRDGAVLDASVKALLEHHGTLSSLVTEPER
jgi:hypothetical protein